MDFRERSTFYWQRPSPFHRSPHELSIQSMRTTILRVGCGTTARQMAEF